MTVKLTIDCMGGDHGPSVTVPAAVNFVRSHPDAQLLLVGIESAIRAQLKKLKAASGLPSACSTSAKKSSRVTTPSNVPANCCARVHLTFTATLRATTFSRA